MWSACHLRLGYEGLPQVSMWCLTERAKLPPSGEAVLFPAILTLYREGTLAAHIALAVRASSFSSLTEALTSKTWRHVCISEAPCCRQMGSQQGVSRNFRFKGNRRYRWWGFCSLTTTLPTFETQRCWQVIVSSSCSRMVSWACFWSHGMWDHSFPTRDWTCDPYSGSTDC